MKKPKSSQRAISIKSALGGDATAAVPVPAVEPVVSVSEVAASSPAPKERAAAPVIRMAAGDVFRVPCWVLDDTSLSSAEKLVLVCLASTADDSGISAAPSQRVISQRCGFTEFWVRETLKGLEQRGYIKTTADSTFKRRRYQFANWPQE